MVRYGNETLLIQTAQNGKLVRLVHGMYYYEVRVNEQIVFQSRDYAHAADAWTNVLTNNRH